MGDRGQCGGREASITRCIAARSSALASMVSTNGKQGSKGSSTKRGDQKLIP